MSDNTNNTPRAPQCLWCKEGRSVGRIPPAHDCPDAPAVQQAPAVQAQISPGAIAIAEERARQMAKEGWTPEHDDEHGRGELACAAACYAVYHTDARVLSPENDTGWPWARRYWKPGATVRNLEKAGALIAAEIDRLLRKDGAAQQAPVLGAAQDDVLRLWRALERIEDEVTAERTGKIVPLAALAGISAILDEAKHGAPAAPPAPLPGAYRALTTAEEIAAALEAGATWAEQQESGPRASSYRRTAPPMRALAVSLRAGRVTPTSCEWDPQNPWSTAIGVAKIHGVDPQALAPLPAPAAPARPVFSCDACGVVGVPPAPGGLDNPLNLGCWISYRDGRPTFICLGCARIIVEQVGPRAASSPPAPLPVGLREAAQRVASAVRCASPWSCPQVVQCPAGTCKLAKEG